MLEHQQPVDSLPARHDGDTGTGLQVTVSASGFLLLQSAAESHLQDALTSQLQLPLPEPLRASVRGAYALLWLTPAEWLLEHPAAETDALQTALTRRLAPSLAAVTDMSDAFARFDVSGPHAAEALMSGCSIDLHADAFPAGCVVRTALADIPAILWNPGEPQLFRCLIDRSFAAHLRDWFLDMSR